MPDSSSHMRTINEVHAHVHTTDTHSDMQTQAAPCGCHQESNKQLRNNKQARKNKPVRHVKECTLVIAHKHRLQGYICVLSIQTTLQYAATMCSRMCVCVLHSIRPCTNPTTTRACVHTHKCITCAYRFSYRVSARVCVCIRRQCVTCVCASSPLPIQRWCVPLSK
jgi:hypothetical protein